VAILAWLIPTIVGGAEPCDFVVAPDGNDSNPGTVAQPFATLAQARDAVRRLLGANRSRDVTVLLRGGTYRLREPVVFRSEDSAADGHRVTYAAWPGEQPVLSGGRTLVGWQSGGADRWTMNIEDVAAGRLFFEQLFLDGQRARRARHPNEGFLRVVAAGSDSRTGFSFRAGDLPPGVSLRGSELVFLHDWSISRTRIGEVNHSSNTITLAHPVGAAGAAFFRIDGFEPHPRYFVEDAIELLDVPGEWHLDRQRGVLSYQAAPRDDLGAVATEVPELDQLLVVEGGPTREATVRNVRFVGLTFAYAAAPRFERGYAGVQAGFHEQRQGANSEGWRGRMPAAVVFRSAHGCGLEDCRVLHVGGTAVSLEGWCCDNRLTGNEVADAGGNGFMIGEPAADENNVATGNQVVNNHVHHCGALFYGCVGVWVGIARETTVAHNEIHDLPYSGVSVGWVWNPTPSPCRANRIERNHIHHVMQTLSDGGGIYTLGRQPGTVLRANLIHDIPTNAGRAESNGLFIDEGSSELVIENNLIYGVARCPIRFHRASGDVVRNNVLVVAEGTPPFQFNATDEKSIVFEANQTPPAAGWSAPTSEQFGAGPKAAAKGAH
jgi:hypothetical protein